MEATEKWKIIVLRSRDKIEDKVNAIINLLKQDYNLRLYDAMEIADATIFEEMLVQSLMGFNSNHYKIDMVGPEIMFQGEMLSKGWLLLGEDAFDERVEVLAEDPFVKKTRHYLQDIEILVEI